MLDPRSYCLAWLTMTSSETERANEGRLLADRRRTDLGRSSIIERHQYRQWRPFISGKIRARPRRRAGRTNTMVLKEVGRHVSARYDHSLLIAARPHQMLKRAGFLAGELLQMTKKSCAGMVVMVDN